MCDCDCELPKRVKWEQIKREHAHELAEKIREAAKGRPPYGFCPEVSTAKGAANLIDPDKEAEG